MADETSDALRAMLTDCQAQLTYAQLAIITHKARADKAEAHVAELLALPVVPAIGAPPDNGPEPVQQIVPETGVPVDG